MPDETEENLATDEQPGYDSESADHSGDLIGPEVEYYDQFSGYASNSLDAEYKEPSGYQPGEKPEQE